MFNRRAFSLLSLAALTAACVPSGRGSAPRGPSGQTPPPRPVPNAGWDAWVEGYKTRAAARGIAPGVINTAFRGAGFLPDVIEKDRNQTEFKRSTEDYLNIAASDERVSMGRQQFGAYRGVLNALESRYGVDAQIIAAVWGLESFFGTRRGNVPVISALSTLAYEGRRGAFFESQLTAALKILQRGDTTPGQMVGSWAGAMGHTQFIPTSYLEYAVDYTGDGRADIWSDDPTDSLASTAAYLSRSGWNRSLPWGMEVSLPSGFNPGLLGRGKGKSAAEWQTLGVRAVSGRGLVPGSILAPGGIGGPAFLLTQNFNAILRYNNAENYALGVGHLSDRLAGAGPLAAAFGPDANGLTKADRQELQRLLTARGFDTEGSDGVIGAKSKAAIERFQASRGLAVTGVPSADLLRILRS
ncbi:lytic murein transglycosylase [Xinfangfangia sp. CPCC 101601]|uniref:Lytic murein transglycosylase n=1 Tax=Pseudogemmobacter lacusdianii TaxID=3069608 RepID=A0ABU0W2M7_9RHOB|nr:lytic murein transglycosylase [Xinfangfangia sp. CPCC 101601]MDQ2068168.1 lytic murein transglycosylase [Xinfangfangia sp. CPCC 101601]